MTTDDTVLPTETPSTAAIFWPYRELIGIAFGFQEHDLTIQQQTDKHCLERTK
jgi:hypothetical protein